MPRNAEIIGSFVPHKSSKRTLDILTQNIKYAGLRDSVHRKRELVIIASTIGIEGSRGLIRCIEKRTKSRCPEQTLLER